ncbi:DNA-3-methyladenine glycosylase [Candidatus Pacearchaeota archaeon]|nr:DNA-3-methyladenine glycosylase [Candidatus Pacearchaeota archaeon]
MDMEKYFGRQADIVARALLGDVLIRKIGKKIMKSRIVETEAYFDEKDPASRAVKGGDLRETMKMKPGTILIYGIHQQWMLNFVTGRKGRAQAVLIRAVEPINYKGNTRGPGRLTKVLKINKKLHRKDLSDISEIKIIPKPLHERIEVETSKRIGVTKDLERHYRFYIKGNEWVSK